MNCSYCNESADFKCDCQKPYMCPYHLGVHLKTKVNHQFENLDNEIKDLRLSKLRNKLLGRIQKVYKAKNEIASNTGSLIRSIERAFEQVSELLDAIINSYIELHKRQKFCGSELPILEKIESFNINIKTFRIDEITSKVQDAYSVDLISYEKIVQNGVSQFLINITGDFSVER